MESQFGLTNSIDRPQTTVFGRDAYPTIPDKAAAFLMAILQNVPFQAGNRRLALAATLAFLELNGKSVDTKEFDEKSAESLIKKAANASDHGLPPQEIFQDLRDLLARSIS